MKAKDIMKMVCLGLFMTITLTSCPSDNGGGSGSGSGPDVPTPQVGKEYKQDVTMSYQDGNKDVVLDKLSHKILGIEYSSSWLSVVSNTYTSGAPSVRINVQKNASTTPRSCNVTITTEGNTEKLLLQITQEAMPNGIDDIHSDYSDGNAYSKASSVIDEE